MYGLKWRIEETEERIRELENRDNRNYIVLNIGTCETITKDLIFMLLESWKEKRMRIGLKKYSKYF